MNLELTELYLNPNLVIASSEVHRWGVFAHKDIAKHDVLQESPYCTFSMKELRKKADVVVRYTYDSSDNPGANEDEEGLPFVGRAGVLLDKMFLFL